MTEPPRTDLAQAAGCVLDQWVALTRFLETGFLPLDNIPVERDIRPIAVGRKNWLFVDSEDGGEWAATNFSVFQSCRLLGLDPSAYIEGIMPDLIADRRDPMALTPVMQAQAAARRCA